MPDTKPATDELIHRTRIESERGHPTCARDTLALLAQLKLAEAVCEPVIQLVECHWRRDTEPTFLLTAAIVAACDEYGATNNTPGDPEPVPGAVQTGETGE